MHTIASPRLNAIWNCSRADQDKPGHISSEQSGPGEPGTHHRDIAITRYQDIAISRYHDFAISRCRDIAILRYRDIAISRYRDDAIPRYRDIAISRFRDIAISRYRVIVITAPFWTDVSRCLLLPGSNFRQDLVLGILCCASWGSCLNIAYDNSKYAFQHSMFTVRCYLVVTDLAKQIACQY